MMILAKRNFGLEGGAKGEREEKSRGKVSHLKSLSQLGQLG